MAQIKTEHLRFLDLLKLSTRIFVVKPSRTFLTILGTSVGISAVVFLVSLGYGFQYLLLGKLVITEDSLATLSLSYPAESGLSISQKDVEEVLKIPKTKEISKLAEFPGEVWSGENSGLALIRAVEGNYFRLSGTNPDIGEAPKDNEPGVVISKQALLTLNLPADASSLGKEVDLKLTYQSDNADAEVKDVSTKQTLHIKGIITNESEAPLVYIPVSQVSEPPPFYKELFVKAENLDSVEFLKEKFSEKGFLISARLDLVSQARKVMNAITIVLAIFGVTALVVSAIGMFNTMIVGFLERIYEVGIMKSLGATDSNIRNLFLMESLIIGISGGVCGVLLGIGAGKFLGFLLNLLAARMGGKPLDLFITPVWFIFLVIGISAFIGLVAGFWPAQRASSLSPKEAFLRK